MITVKTLLDTRNLVAKNTGKPYIAADAIIIENWKIFKMKLLSFKGIEICQGKSYEVKFNNDAMFIESEVQTTEQKINQVFNCQGCKAKADKLRLLESKLDEMLNLLKDVK